MRRSSRGNPWHDERGRFTSPGKVSMVTGEPIKAGAVASVTDRDDSYYEQRTRERFGESDQDRKERQAEIISFANPADDDTHTWIRSSDDIMSFDELGDEIDGDVTPDYTQADYEEAKRTGYITVYSSHDIQTGTFVTPSKMEAESYGSNVRSMRVKTSDVAWIDSVEGQYVGDGRFTDSYGFNCRVVNGNCHAGLRGEPTPDYIRCSGVDDNGSFDPSKVEPVKNNNNSMFISKPLGGVWMSPSNTDWGWSDWCEYEGMTDWNNNPERLQIKGARIAHIYNQNQAERLPHTVSSQGAFLFDFEEISKHYDAIEVHISEDGMGLTQSMYGWDCDTTLVFNPDVIKKP